MVKNGVMKRVLQKKEHRLEGAALIVKPYEESIKKDNHSLMADTTQTFKFYGKLQQEASKSVSDESTQLAQARDTTSAYVRKGRGITFASNTSPPGLAVTEEGKRFARDLIDRVKGDQSTDPAQSIRSEDELERKESSNGPFKKENQESKDNDQNSNDNKLNRVPGIRLPHKDGVTDPEESKKDTIEKSTTGNGRKPPTDENTNNLVRPNQPENVQETGVQSGYSTFNAANHGASYPKEPSPLNHLQTSPASENLAPTASHERVSVRDVVEERRATNSDTGSEPLFEMQKTHSTGEPKCSMCMNLNKDPVNPVNCGHYFCKFCTKSFIEKTMICPVCKKDNQFRGNQPLGYMAWRTESWNSLPGYEEFGTIVLTFNFVTGIQGSDHPNPGEPHSGLFCTSYLPNNPAGQEVCNLLRSAFDARLLFTIGECPATGEKNKIVSNGIELKWSRSGGPANCGYPDPNYLDRVKSQLTEKVITQPISAFREEFVKRSPSTKGSPLKKRSVLSNVVTSARPFSGRRRGISASNFYGRPYEEVESKPSDSVQLAYTCGTKSANAVRGRVATDRDQHFSKFSASTLRESNPLES